MSSRKKEIEKLKATQTPGVDTQQLVKTITQAMPCMYVGTKKSASDQETRGKPFLGTNRPPELSKGLDGSLDPNFHASIVKISAMKRKIVGSYRKNWLMTVWKHKNIRPQETTTIISSEPN